IPDLSVEDSGDLLLAVHFAKNLDIEVASFVATGSSDLLIAKLHPDGSLRWARAFGGISAAAKRYGRTATVEPGGETTLVFSLGMTGPGSIDFGSGALAPVGNGDIAVQHLAP